MIKLDFWGREAVVCAHQGTGDGSWVIWSWVVWNVGGVRTVVQGAGFRSIGSTLLRTSVR